MPLEGPEKKRAQLKRPTAGAGVEKPAPARAATSEGGAPDERLFIASLEKGLKVLETFPDMTSELGLQEIAAATGLGKSAVQRLVYTLHHLRYLRRDPGTRKYRLSSKVFLRGYTLARTSDLVREAHGQLVRINRECGDTCVLAILEGPEIVILSSVQGRHIDSLNVAVGMRFPASATSSGLALLAWLPPEEAKLTLDGAAGTPSDDALGHRLDGLAAEFATVRAQGFCITEDKIAAGHLSVSVPVFNASGYPVAAVNVSTLKHLYTAPEARRALTDLVVGAGKVVSARLGYSSNSGEPKGGGRS